MSKNERDSKVVQELGLQERAGRAARLRRWVAAIVGILAAVTLVARARSDTTAVTRYETKPVERGKLMVTVSATGNLEPINQVDVGSEVSGIVETVDVDYNDSVRVGQTLAKLDTDRLEAQVLESRAVLESAQAKVVNAEATLAEKRLALDRAKKLVEEALLPQSDQDAAKAEFERARAELAAARAQVTQSEATLNARQTDLGKAIVRSPINGIVLDRNVEPGQTVAASLQAPVLFTLAEDLTQMELHVAVDEADVGSVHPGQSATFTVDAHPDRSFPARITAVRYAPKTVDGVVTYEAVLQVDNSDLLLRPGMTATAEIAVETVEDGLLVPNAALRFEPPAQTQRTTGRSAGLLAAILPRPPRRTQNREPATDPRGQTVWMLEDGRPVAVPIKTGATDGLKTECLSGSLRPGFEVIVDAQTGGAA